MRRPPHVTITLREERRESHFDLDTHVFSYGVVQRNDQQSYRG